MILDKRPKGDEHISGYFKTSDPLYFTHSSNNMYEGTGNTNLERTLTKYGIDPYPHLALIRR